MMGYSLNIFNELEFKLIFVVNDITRNFLITEAKVSPAKVRILYPSIDNGFYIPETETSPAKQFDILLSGQAGWTKGTDLIPQLIYQIEKKRGGEEIHIGWIGSVDQVLIQQINYELALAGIARVTIEFLGILTNIKPVLESCELFISLSRADAMPTACIEAMALGKPIICFKGSGGMESLVKDKCGYVVNYPDLEKMAEHIQELRVNKSLYQQFSNEAKSMAVQFSAEHAAEQFISSIDKVFNEGMNH
jgi:glycosyltransferase involved in cell wall biosynthesis